MVVWSPASSPRLSPREAMVVLPLRAFDADLGMTTPTAVRRQLALDVPRSIVLWRGERMHDSEAVYHLTPFPRLCTQAVMAPALEWLLRAGWLTHEVGDPMVVDVSRRGVCVSKRLGTHDALCTFGTVDVSIEADVRNGLAVLAWTTTPSPT